MIKVYLAGISTLLESEDIEIRYCIFKNEELFIKQSVLLEYKKPAIVGQVALITLLKTLEEDFEEEITVLVNDAALYEFIKGTSTTKNMDVLKMAREMRKEMEKFKKLEIIDVSQNRKELLKWDELLQN